MDNDNSNEVVAINSDDDDEVVSPYSDKPIIQLFKRLITNNSKQNTVLTNAQIIDILKKEFDINVLTLHELEGDIYLTIMKKYLKEWPQWDDLDRIISNLKSKNKNADINKTLEINYINLKNYLKHRIESSTPLVKETIQKIKNMEQQQKIKDKKESFKKIVLEIQASRNQLNQLIYRHPHPDYNNTVFNPVPMVPNQINLGTISIEGILNWWGVTLTLTHKNLSYKRSVTHELKHLLVNRSLKREAEPVEILDQDVKICFKKIEKCNTLEYIIVINELRSSDHCNQEILDFIMKDLKMMPKKNIQQSIYKRYMNKYPYKRYLYADVDTKKPIDLTKYDLQIEETIKPSYRVQLNKIKNALKYIVVECEPCEIQFEGVNLVRDLKNHFNMLHASERDWTCGNCNKQFVMSTLSENWWCHRC